MEKIAFLKTKKYQVYVILIMVMCLVATNLMAQDISTRIIITGDVSYLNNVIETEQIAHFSNQDLRILRNTIFAKYGYQFISEDLQAHFAGFPWYNGNKPDIQDELSETDWINIAIIQSLESNGATLQGSGSFGEHLIISEKIYPLKLYSQEPGEIDIDGEIIAFANGVEIARVDIIDNEFLLVLDEVPQDILRHWGRSYDKVVQCSDPETRLAYLDLRITGTEIDIIGAATHSSDKDPSLRQYSLEEKRPGMKVDDYYYDEYFSYIYSDRAAVLRGVIHDEDSGQGKIVYNMSLKRGWNRIRHYKAEIKEFAKYRVNISEASIEKGFFEFYYYDFDDYLNNNTTRQPATLEGRIVVQKNRDLQDEYYFLLKKPIMVNKENVHKLLLLVNNRIHETFPDKGNYIIYGDIQYFTSIEDDIILYVLEIKEKEQNPIWIILAIIAAGISISIILILKKHFKKGD